MKYIFYKVTKFILKPIFILIYRPTYVGRSNIPKDGAVIIAGNHTSYLDAAMMVSGPKRIVHTLAKQELFKNGLGNFFFRSMACIPVNRKSHDKNAKDEAVNVLNNGEVIGIFPEGTRNKNEKGLLPFKYGAVSFAKKTGAYIVPFAITGKYKPFKKGIKITYGEPYKVNDDLDIENEKLRNIVIKLKTKGEKDEKENRK